MCIRDSTGSEHNGLTQRRRLVAASRLILTGRHPNHLMAEHAVDEHLLVLDLALQILLEISVRGCGDHVLRSRLLGLADRLLVLIALLDAATAV